MNSSITELQGLHYSVAYTSREATGVSILVAVSLISLVPVIVILLVIALSAYNTRKSSHGVLFVRSPLAACFISLMLCWVIQFTGSIMNARWLQEMKIDPGSACTAQGVFKHIADIGIAVWTTAIAGHTFSTLFLEVHTTALAMWIVFAGSWLFIGIIVCAGPAFVNTTIRGPFYDVSGYWCWISPEYAIQRITLGYMLMFLGAFLVFVLYMLTFFRLRGNLVRAGLAIEFRKVSSDRESNYPEKYFANDHAKTAAKQMLLYPISYVILLLPIVITRFVAWSGVEVPFEWVIFSDSVYLISGLVNVILFTTIRRLLPGDSLRLGNWYLIPGSRPPVPPPKDDASSDPLASIDRAEKGFSKTVTFAAEPPIRNGSPPTRKDSKRPPELVLSDRDSFGSMYSVREGVDMAAISSHWSPDTPPLQKSGRLSICWQNMSNLRP